MSPVLENIIDRPLKHRRSERVIPVVGVPCDAVVAFVGFLYSTRLVFFSTCLNLSRSSRRANFFLVLNVERTIFSLSKPLTPGIFKPVISLGWLQQNLGKNKTIF